jgi:hypothetical protein
VFEDAIWTSIHGNTTALDRRNFTALCQTRFHDQHPRRALRYRRHELYPAPVRKDRQWGMSWTGGKINGAVAQRFYVSQRSDMHNFNVLPFLLLKDFQLLGNYQGKE